MRYGIYGISPDDNDSYELLGVHYDFGSALRSLRNTQLRYDAKLIIYRDDAEILGRIDVIDIPQDSIVRYCED